MVAAQAQKVDLLVIAGPTASGKSDLALKIARKFRGEIIAADSRTVYKGMDIGTAKPTEKEQLSVSHWGLDLIEPGRRFSAAQYKAYAEARITDIQKRGKLPVLVGGTGLYIDSVIFDFDFPQAADDSQRQKLEKMTTPELQSVIRDKKYLMPENYKNRRHLIRTIEREGRFGKRAEVPKKGVTLLGLLPPDETLRRNIDRRAEKMFNHGVIEETEELVKDYGRPAIQSTGGIIYAICMKLIDGEIDLAEAKELFKKADWQYARRQRTWFGRNKFIQWFDNSDSAFVSVSQLLNK